MGTSTSGLGSIDHQDIPGLVLQILISIGVDDEIIPLDYEDKFLGNLWNTVITSGFLALDLHFNLRKSELDHSESNEDFQLRCEATIFSLHKLFAFKQLFMGKTSFYGGIKWHTILHFCYFRRLYGVVPNFEMIVYEHSHVGIKALHRRTARSRHGNFEDLLKRMLSSDLCAVLRDSFMASHPRVFERFFYPKRALDRSKLYSHLKTENDVEFYCSKKSNRIEILLTPAEDNLFFGPADVDTAQFFMHPSLSLQTMSNFVLNDFPEENQREFEAWKSKEEGSK